VKKVTNTENWSQRAVSVPDDVVQKALELVCERNLESLEKWARVLWAIFMGAQKT
jgi:hypothetical protein